MGKLLTFFLGALLGIIIGGLLVFSFFGGAPRAANVPGKPIQPPEANGLPPGTAQIVLRQDFFNNVLNTIFRDMNAPSFPLGLAENQTANPNTVSYGLVQGAACENKISLLAEGSGVQTGVNFADNTIKFPLAFSGTYNLPVVGCQQFAGWAQSSLALNYDESQQAVFGRVNVETVNLDGIAPFVSGFVTPIVQTTINNRVNPIQILQGKQIALNLPIAATGGNLQAQVQDVRAEIKDDALHLYVIYNFSGKSGN